MEETEKRQMCEDTYTKVEMMDKILLLEDRFYLMRIFLGFTLALAIILTIAVCMFKRDIKILQTQMVEVQVALNNKTNEVEELRDKVNDLQVKYQFEHEQVLYSNNYLEQLLQGLVEELNYMKENGVFTVKSYLAMSELERELVERVVQAEAGNQSMRGIQATAQCILDTAEAEDKTLYVVACCEGQYTTPADYVSDKVHEACVEVFDNHNLPVDEPIRWFYSIAGGGYSSWHENSSNLEYVCTIDDHKYYKLKGT